MRDTRYVIDTSLSNNLSYLKIYFVIMNSQLNQLIWLPESEIHGRHDME